MTLFVPCIPGATAAPKADVHGAFRSIFRAFEDCAPDSHVELPQIRGDHLLSRLEFEGFRKATIAWAVTEMVYFWRYADASVWYPRPDDLFPSEPYPALGHSHGLVRDSWFSILAEEQQEDGTEPRAAYFATVQEPSPGVPHAGRRTASLHIDLGYQDVLAKRKAPIRLEQLYLHLTDFGKERWGRHGDADALFELSSLVSSTTEPLQWSEDAGENPPLRNLPLTAKEALAYRAYVFVENALGHSPTDKEAYDWLRENGIEGCQDLEGYKLPPKSGTWLRYMREARSRAGMQKNSRRTPGQSRSIVAPEHLTARRDNPD